MVKLIIFLAVIVFCCAAVAGAGECPPPRKVQNCTPKCLHDSECSHTGGKCCPNICSGRSCAQPNVLMNTYSGPSAFGRNDKYNRGSEINCGGVICSSFEKCDMDKSTKRPKCVPK